MGGTAPFDIFLNGEYQITTNSFPTNFQNLENGLNRIGVEDSNGCAITDEFDVSVAANIEVFLPRDTTVQLGNSIVLNPIVSTSPERIEWTPAGLVNCDTCLNPTITPTSETTLTITCLLYTSPSPRDRTRSRMPSSA